MNIDQLIRHLGLLAIDILYLHLHEWLEVGQVCLLVVENVGLDQQVIHNDVNATFDAQVSALGSLLSRWIGTLELDVVLTTGDN